MRKSFYTLSIKKQYTALLYIIVFMSGITKGFCAQTVTITIDPKIQSQVIQGWGVSLSWWANLVGGMPQSIIDSITKLAAVDLNLNVFRFNIGGGENPHCTSGKHIRTDGGDMPGYRAQCADQAGWGTCDLTNDARQIKVMDKLAGYRNDIITEICSFSPPWWMTKSECVAGNVDGSDNIKPEFIDDFADYLATVTAALKKRNPAWNIRYIEPFNEPLSAWWKKGGKQEGCKFTAATQATLLQRLWKSQETYNIRIIGLSVADDNSISESIENMTALKNNNPDEFNTIVKINTHTYSGSWQEKANLYTLSKNNGNKALWQSETGPLGWTPADGKSWWQSYYIIAYRLIEDLRNLQCPVWCDWQMMSLDEGWGLIKQTNFDESNPNKTAEFIKTRGFYCRKNITNFIKAGYQIINSSNGNSIAAINPANTEAVISIANQSGTSSSYTIDLSNFSTIGDFRTYRTSGDYTSTENCTEKTTQTNTEKGTIKGKQISYIAPPYSITTFVIQTGSTSLLDKKNRADLCRVISPNLLSSFVSFKTGMEMKNAAITIYDIVGREVKTIKNITGYEAKISRKNLTKGIYVYRLTQDGKVIANGAFILNNAVKF